MPWIFYFYRNHPLLFFYLLPCYTFCKVVNAMETKDIILELRTKHGLSQDALAEKVHVTRQAVSRWENGDTIHNT